MCADRPDPERAGPADARQPGQPACPGSGRTGPPAVVGDRRLSSAGGVSSTCLFGNPAGNAPQERFADDFVASAPAAADVTPAQPAAAPGNSAGGSAAEQRRVRAAIGRNVAGSIDAQSGRTGPATAPRLGGWPASAGALAARPARGRILLDRPGTQPDPVSDRLFHGRSAGQPKLCYGILFVANVDPVDVDARTVRCGVGFSAAHSDCSAVGPGSGGQSFCRSFERTGDDLSVSRSLPIHVADKIARSLYAGGGVGSLSPRGGLLCRSGPCGACH